MLHTLLSSLFLCVCKCIIFVFSDDNTIEFENYDDYPFAFETLKYFNDCKAKCNGHIYLGKTKFDLQLGSDILLDKTSNYFVELKQIKIHIEITKFLFLLLLRSNFDFFVKICKKNNLMKIIRSKIYFFMKKRNSFMKKIIFCMLMHGYNPYLINFQFFKFKQNNSEISEFSTTINKFLDEDKSYELNQYKEKILNKILELQYQNQIKDDSFEDEFLHWEESFKFILNYFENYITLTFKEKNDSKIFNLSGNVQFERDHVISIAIENFKVENLWQMFDDPIFSLHKITSCTFQYLTKVLNSLNIKFMITIDITTLFINLINLTKKQLLFVNIEFVGFLKSISKESKFVKLRISSFQIKFQNANFFDFTYEKMQKNYCHNKPDEILHACIFIINNIELQSVDFCLTKISQKYINYYDNKHIYNFHRYHFLYLTKGSGDDQLSLIKISCEDKLAIFESKEKKMIVNKDYFKFLNLNRELRNKKNTISSYNLTKDAYIRLFSAVIDRTCATIQLNLNVDPIVYNKTKSKPHLIQDQLNIRKENSSTQYFFTEFDIILRSHMRIISLNLQSKLIYEELDTNAFEVYISNCEILVFDSLPQNITSFKIYYSRIILEFLLSIANYSCKKINNLNLYAFKTTFNDRFRLEGRFNEITLSSCNEKFCIDAFFISVEIIGFIEDYEILGCTYFRISGNASCSYFFFNNQTRELKATNIIFKSRSIILADIHKTLKNCKFDN